MTPCSYGSVPRPGYTASLILTPLACVVNAQLQPRRRVTLASRPPAGPGSLFKCRLRSSLLMRFTKNWQTRFSSLRTRATTWRRLFTLELLRCNDHARGHRARLSGCKEAGQELARSKPPDLLRRAACFGSTAREGEADEIRVESQGASYHRQSVKEDIRDSLVKYIDVEIEI